MSMTQAIDKLKDEAIKGLDSVCPLDNDKKCEAIMDILLAHKELLEYTSKLPTLERYSSIT